MAKTAKKEIGWVGFSVHHSDAPPTTSDFASTADVSSLGFISVARRVADAGYDIQVLSTQARTTHSSNAEFQQVPRVG
jgi:hypothetical protein